MSRARSLRRRMGGIGLDVERYSCQIAIYGREYSEGARYEGRTEVRAF